MTVVAFFVCLSSCVCHPLLPVSVLTIGLGQLVYLGLSHNDNGTFEDDWRFVNISSGIVRLGDW